LTGGSALKYEERKVSSPLMNAILHPVVQHSH
jgi:hypothetical protein